MWLEDRRYALSDRLVEARPDQAFQSSTVKMSIIDRA